MDAGHPRAPAPAGPPPLRLRTAQARPAGLRRRGRALVADAAAARLPDGGLRYRDGLPILDPEGTAGVRAAVLRFAPGQERAAYDAVCGFEPRHHYRWHITDARLGDGDVGAGQRPPGPSPRAGRGRRVVHLVVGRRRPPAPLSGSTPSAGPPSTTPSPPSPPCPATAPPCGSASTACSRPTSCCGRRSSATPPSPARPATSPSPASTAWATTSRSRRAWSPPAWPPWPRRPTPATRAGPAASGRTAAAPCTPGSRCGPPSATRAAPPSSRGRCCAGRWWSCTTPSASSSSPACRAWPTPGGTSTRTASADQWLLRPVVSPDGLSQ